MIPKLKLSLFKHIRAGTKYITIPSKYAEDDISPLRGVNKARMLLYYVKDGKIIDPETRQTVARLDGEVNGDGLLLIIEKTSIEKQ